MAQGVNMVVFVSRIILGNARFISALPDKQLPNTLTLSPTTLSPFYPKESVLAVPNSLLFEDTPYSVYNQRHQILMILAADKYLPFLLRSLIRDNLQSIKMLFSCTIVADSIL